MLRIERVTCAMRQEIEMENTVYHILAQSFNKSHLLHFNIIMYFCDCQNILCYHYYGVQKDDIPYLWSVLFACLLIQAACISRQTL